MAKQIDKIARRLGAKVKGKLVAEAAGGAFGAARLPALVAELQERLQPGKGERPGRPTDPTWTLRRLLPLSKATYAKLEQAAEQASSGKRRVSPMQVAARIIEQALATNET